MDHRFVVEPSLIDYRSIDAEPSLMDHGVLSSGSHVDVSLVVDISIEKVPDIDIIPIATGDADDDDDWNDFEGPAALNADGPRIEDDDAVSREGVFVEANTEKQLSDIDIIPITTGDAADDDDWNDFEDCSKDRRIEAAALDAPWLGSSSQPLTLHHATSNETLFKASVADQHLREPIANCALSQVIIRPSD
jgi:hypothetical protein